MCEVSRRGSDGVAQVRRRGSGSVAQVRRRGSPCVAQVRRRVSDAEVLVTAKEQGRVHHTGYAVTINDCA